MSQQVSGHRRHNQSYILHKTEKDPIILGHAEWGFAKVDSYLQSLFFFIHLDSLLRSLGYIVTFLINDYQ